MSVCLCVCDCVCMRVRERDGGVKISFPFLPSFSVLSLPLPLPSLPGPPFPVSSSSFHLQLASRLYSQDAEAQQTDAVINQLRQVVATLQTRLFEEHVQVSQFCTQRSLLPA